MTLLGVPWIVGCSVKDDLKLGSIRLYDSFIPTHFIYIKIANYIIKIDKDHGSFKDFERYILFFSS